MKNTTKKDRHIKKSSSFRLKDETLKLIEQISRRTGFTKTDVLELAIHRCAQAEGVKK